MAKYAGEYLYENLNNHLPLSSLSAVVYNVKAYGAKGDGAVDDTKAVQAAVNAANADGASLVFFPPGMYKVTSLSNTSTINFVGDNASFLGYSGAINQIGIANYTSLPTASATFRNTMAIVHGGTGVADVLYICLKSAADTYSWKTVVTG